MSYDPAATAATHIDGHFRSFPAPVAISQYARVKLDGSGNLALAGADDLEVGEIWEAAFTGGILPPARSVRLVTSMGTTKMIAAGAIGVMAQVFRAANGQITATPHGFALGFALMTATASGDVIEVLRYTDPGNANASAATTSVAGLVEEAAAVTSLTDNTTGNNAGTTLPVGAPIITISIPIPALTGSVVPALLPV